jgi:nonsense-mediated mRNA decay protein 3
MIICPKCGASSDELEFIDAFCTDCFEFKVKMPKGIVLSQCTRCKKIKIKTDWKNPTPKQVSEYVTSKCRGEFTSAEFDSSTKTIKFILEREGKTVEINKEIPFEVSPTICTSCSRAAGGYYESILQIRGEDADRVESKARKLVEMLRKKTFVSKLEEMHGGLDMYVGSTKVVFETLQKLNIKPTKITRKLSGRREGKKLYRTTFAIRV